MTAKKFFTSNMKKETGENRLLFTHLEKNRKRIILFIRKKTIRFWIGLRKTASKKYIIIGTGSFTTGEEYYLLADGNEITPKLIEKREEGIKYETEHNGNYFYFLTNFDALNYRVMKTPGNCYFKEKTGLNLYLRKKILK